MSNIAYRLINDIVQAKFGGDNALADELHAEFLTETLEEQPTGTRS